MNDIEPSIIWHPVIYWTDAFIFVIALCIFLLIRRIRKSPDLRANLSHVFQQGRYSVALIVLSWFALIGLIDSIHFEVKNHSVVTKSLLDFALSPLDTQNEVTYSAPFALTSFSQEIIKKPDGTIQEIYPPLEHVAQGLQNPTQERTKDIIYLFLRGLVIAAGISFLIWLVFNKKLNSIIPANARIAFWSAMITTVTVTAVLYSLMFHYHVLGTNKTGQDVLYLVLKSIRTGLVIGTVTTFIMLPFALLLGMWSGYFRGLIDDAIQYLYTTLSSVPAVLLIAAAVVSLQTKTEKDPELKLLLLCIILGVTSWIGLCRLLRGETLKLREMEFVLAARAMGIEHFSIIYKHILPNLLYIVVISLVLDFSGLVLAEAVLSFIGVGVDPTTHSFGNMINAARLEMARDPIVWWSLFGAFTAMFLLVFSANVLAEAVQEALNTKRV